MVIPWLHGYTVYLTSKYTSEIIKFDMQVIYEHYKKQIWNCYISIERIYQVILYSQDENFTSF